MALPETPRSRASASATARARSISSRSRATSAGTAWASTIAPGRPRARWAWTNRGGLLGVSAGLQGQAAVEGGEGRQGVGPVADDGHPARFPGRRGSPARRGSTSRPSRRPGRRRRRPIRRGRWTRRTWSPASRWTPPSPPVAMTPIPQRRAIQRVAETVVAASSPRATAAARSRRPALANAPERARCSSSASERPTVMRPFNTATVAGVAPAARTAASASLAVSRFSGQGSPWATKVDSRATIAPASRSEGARAIIEGRSIAVSEGRRTEARRRANRCPGGQSSASAQTPCVGTTHDGRILLEFMRRGPLTNACESSWMSSRVPRGADRSSLIATTRSSWGVRGTSIARCRKTRRCLATTS